MSPVGEVLIFARFVLKESDFFKHKTMKQNDKIKYFGVVMTPISCPHFPLNMWQVFYSQIQVADALSHALPHFCWQEFWHLVPDTQPLPISIPQNSWQNWHLCLRAAMLFFSTPRPCSFYMATICLSPSTIYFKLAVIWSSETTKKFTE